MRRSWTIVEHVAEARISASFAMHPFCVFHEEWSVRSVMFESSSSGLKSSASRNRIKFVQRTQRLRPTPRPHKCGFRVVPIRIRGKWFRTDSCVTANCSESVLFSAGAASGFEILHILHIERGRLVRNVIRLPAACAAHYPTPAVSDAPAAMPPISSNLILFMFCLSPPNILAAPYDNDSCAPKTQRPILCCVFVDPWHPPPSVQ